MRLLCYPERPKLPNEDWEIWEHNGRYIATWKYPGYQQTFTAKSVKEAVKKIERANERAKEGARKIFEMFQKSEDPKTQKWANDGLANLDRMKGGAA